MNNSVDNVDNFVDKQIIFNIKQLLSMINLITI